MKLYHVSEEPDICEFKPRIPQRKDLNQSTGLVWAIDERHLPNFLTPRECPRVAYQTDHSTTEEDKKRFFTSHESNYALIIESGWFEVMRNTKLYIYEFNTDNFVLQDAAAGYYISRVCQKPIDIIRIDDIFAELIKRNIELRIVSSLWDIADEVKNSSLVWSLCRMRNAKPRK